MTRHVAVLTVGQMHGLQIPEIDDPWVQHSDRLAAVVEWSARIYVRRPEEVFGELQRACPSRIVRTPEGRVVVNGNPGRPAGQCHRELPVT
jgi:hypothetical protein